MWHPENPIRHSILPARWPAHEEAAQSLLFTPISVGSVTLESRTWVPAMVPWRATDDGFVTRNIIEWYGRFAAGRPGGIVVEATGVRDIASGPLLRIGHDRFIQIIDFLSVKRRQDKDKYFARFFKLNNDHRKALVETTGDTNWAAASEED